MKLKAFTLVEILVSVLILAILSSVGIVLWDGAVDNARQRICAQNQYILDESLKIYIYDKEAVPISLSSLVPEYSAFAIAKISKENFLFKPARNISLALININDGRQAWASSVFSDYIMGNKSILRCPANKGGGLSYGYNIQLKDLEGGAAIDKYKELQSNSMPIICDCDNSTFDAPDGNINGAAFRHGKIGGDAVAVAIGGDGPIQITPDNTNYQNGRRLGTLGAPGQQKKHLTNK